MRAVETHQYMYRPQWWSTPQVNSGSDVTYKNVTAYIPHLILKLSIVLHHFLYNHRLSTFHIVEIVLYYNFWPFPYLHVPNTEMYYHIKYHLDITRNV